MTRISQSDQVVRLLREQLDKTARKEPTARTSAVGRNGAQDPLARLKAVADEEMGQAARNRALVRALLTDGLGADVANDPAFQDVVERVTTMIEREPGGDRLLADAMKQLLS